MNDWIICAILAAIGIFMTVCGAYLVCTWDKRVSSWKSTPDTSEYFGCLAEGWIGAMSVVLGVSSLGISVFVMICLLV